MLLLGPAHDVAVAECAAGWERRRRTPAPACGGRSWTRRAPLGYDFAQIFPDGAQSAGAGFLRMEPWRIRTQRVAALGPPHVWSARRQSPPERPWSASTPPWTKTNASSKIAIGSSGGFALSK